MELIRKKLETSRLELLDMGLRGNTLLHFPRRAKSLEIVDEISHEVFRLLVDKQKSMTFSPVPNELIDEYEQIDNTRPLPKLLEEMFGDKRHTDTRLQTKLSADQLDKLLVKIAGEARTYYQEQGVDILFLALGFLVWFEDKNSDMPRKAPLILVPVELVRNTAKERFKISYTLADLSPNLTLEAKLKTEFQLELPQFGEELDVQAYYRALEECIQNEPRWHILENEMALGFFSFGKFQMYQDLDQANWPADKQPENHPVLTGLLGEGFSGSFQGESHESDSCSDLADMHLVKDADSSQTEAVKVVKKGSHLVIQGPPGTGKSQTITNIISESLADGKTVLFVAEKMAALEVVKRRLDECHLGDAVLELHSHKSNKRAVLEDLRQTLELGEPDIADRSLEKKLYKQLRQYLDTYCTQVNQPVLNAGINYISALGQLSKLGQEAAGHRIPELNFQMMRDWDHETYLEACALIGKLVDHLRKLGPAVDNVFALSSLTHFSPVEEKQARDQLQKANELLSACQRESNELASILGVPNPGTLFEIGELFRIAQKILMSPDLTGIKLVSDEWQAKRQNILSLLSNGKEMSLLKRRRNDQVIDQAWDADLLTTRQVWVSTGRRWWRFLSPAFWKAKSNLQGLLTQSLPVETEECIRLLDDILKYQSLKKQYLAEEPLGDKLFGVKWQGVSSDWEALSRCAGWVIGLYEEIAKAPRLKELPRKLESGAEIGDRAERIQSMKETCDHIPSFINRAAAILETPFNGEEDPGIERLELKSLQKTVSEWTEHLKEIYPVTHYNRLRKELQEKGLGEIGQLSFNWRQDPGLLLSTLKTGWYGGLVHEAYKTCKTIKNFDRTHHERVIEEFRELDIHLFRHAQESLVEKHHAQIPVMSGAGEMAVLRREMNKKRRHMPIRRLIAQAGRAIQQAKPVFMMSPMSVAKYLAQGTIDFDLVIFDEASQVRVVDAIGPILRGKQVVVVGDTRQMPPTDFFSKSLLLDDEEAEESMTADIESILSMFLAQGAPERLLRWHYRSRHDSLIAVSNQEFYESKLMIFPSPGVNPQAGGLSFEHIDYGIYERGGSRTNPIEAVAVAEAVMKHARLTPQLTLGVVAFSSVQRDCILLELERLRRKDSSCEDFFDPGALESFFVKNLENVQGDERDTIFISVGYGRTDSGKVIRSFGPLNREGGERRLNVLITRARLSMVVFCNFTADDLSTKATSPLGVRALKNFLRFAETGALETRKETGKDTDSPFEDDVVDAIRQLGYDVEPRVGSAGLYIDIGVIDPEKPGRYILAVECDGAGYHSSANARDRDRLRQSVLEGLGWRFHRIWSTDWYREKQNEIKRLKQAIENALFYYRELENNHTESSERSATVPRIQRGARKEATVTYAAPYTLASDSLNIPYKCEIHELSLDVLCNCLQTILEVEGPLHVREAAKRITETAGFVRTGARILDQVFSAVKYGHHLGKFFLSGEFLYQDQERKVALRDRGQLPSAYKKIDLVPPEEVALALVTAVNTSFTLTRDEAISEALSILGFQRTTAKAKSCVEKILQTVEKEGRLKIEHDKITLG
ncbi:MAG: DUF3320 domain-containing protein [Acidobacteriota bacterium]|nr:DUF3320 domain-containing protein [Acidobacteriota bacterium]